MFPQCGNTENSHYILQIPKKETYVLDYSKTYKRMLEYNRIKCISEMNRGTDGRTGVRLRLDKHQLHYLAQYSSSTKT